MADTQLATLAGHVAENEDAVSAAALSNTSAQTSLQTAQQFADQKAQELSDAQGMLNASVDALVAYATTLKKP